MAQIQYSQSSIAGLKEALAALQAQAAAVGTGSTAALAEAINAEITARTNAINAVSATVYFGASGVTTTTGMPLPAGASATVNTQAAIYGIVASGTQTIGVMETF